MVQPEVKVPEEKLVVLTLADVRPVLAEISQSSPENHEKIKELIASYGVDKLSAMKAEDLPALLETAKKLK